MEKEAMHRMVSTELSPDDSERNCCNKKFCWLAPSPGSIHGSFCNETTIHGVQFLGQANRHLTERIFWLVAIIASLLTATYLIYEVLSRYQQSPVIVSFQSRELRIDSIPFPAVTFCNVNKFPKTKVEELQRQVKLPNHPNHEQAKQQLTIVKSICSAQRSFAKEFAYAFNRGKVDKVENISDTVTITAQHAMIDFLLEHTIPCEKLIRLCMFGGIPMDCEDLFIPIVTDYGKCCTFNILPLPLLLKIPQNKDNVSASIYDNPALERKRYWDEKELKLWKQWNYEENGFILKADLMRPWRQKRPGLPYGLSVLLDPDTEDYFCPASDVEGFRYVLHTPLEMPHVMEFASIADVGKEIIVKVRSDMTNADENIVNFDHKKRECYFGKEKRLDFFGPYTGGNCMDECASLEMKRICGCTLSFISHYGVPICKNDFLSGTDEVRCLQYAREKFLDTSKDECGHCYPLCEDIAYTYETTSAALLNASGLWFDVPHPEYRPPPSWANHKMSVMHIFFGSETTVPKVRSRLYGATDLIANIGGILGICLGLSVLSGVEVFYFVTLRSFWKCCRNRTGRIGRKGANKIVQVFTSGERVIRVDPNRIPV